VKSEDIWTEENSAEIYSKFKQVIRGSAADQWVRVLQEKKKKTLAKFEKISSELTKVMLLKDPAERQIKYVQTTKEPMQLNVQERVGRIKTINEYLPRMEPEQGKLTDKQIINRILVENMPGHWQENFIMANGTQCKTLLNAVEILRNIELL
jgi:hypothetical protein